MATNVTFEQYSHPPTPDGRVSVLSGVLSLADVVVNTSPNSTGGWNTATVTADLQRDIYLNAANAASAGVEVGWYRKVAAALFRRGR